MKGGKKKMEKMDGKGGNTLSGQRMKTNDTKINRIWKGGIDELKKQNVKEKKCT